MSNQEKIGNRISSGFLFDYIVLLRKNHLMDVIVGFTGTRKGMTNAQKDTLGYIVKRVEAVCFRHGDCIGADKEAHGIVTALAIKTVIHPPTDPTHRAYCTGNEIWEPKGYLVRNKDIVNNSGLLIATPGEFNEQRRSGTWSTIRYARKQGVNVIVIFPDGTVSK